MMPDHRATAFRPLHFPDHPDPLGAVNMPVADHLLRRGLLADTARLSLHAGDPTTRLEDIREELFRQRWIEPPRHEQMPVTMGPQGAEVAQLDRSALRILGFWAQKVHINGLVETAGGSGPLVWISRRARQAPSNPGRWDTLIAGGRAVGYSIAQTAEKEGWEEAGIRPQNLAQLRRVGDMAVQYVSDRGFHQELLVIYDLTLPEDFRAICHDGEIEESARLPLPDLKALLNDPDQFKFSSYLILRDLIARHPAAVPV